MGGHDNVGKRMSGLVLGLALVLMVFLSGIAQGATSWSPTGGGANNSPGGAAVNNTTFTRNMNNPTTCDNAGSRTTGNYVSASVGECIDSGGIFLDGLQSMAIGNIGTTHFWYTAWVSDRPDGNEAQALVPYAPSCFNATNPAFSIGASTSGTYGGAGDWNYPASGEHGYFLSRPLNSAYSTGISGQAGVFTWETDTAAAKNRGGLTGGTFSSSGKATGVARADGVYVSGVSTGGISVVSASWISGNIVEFVTSSAMPAAWGTGTDVEFVATLVDKGTFNAGTAGTYINQAASDVSWAYSSKPDSTHLRVTIPGITGGSTSVAGGTVGLLAGGRAVPADATNGLNNMGYTFDASIAAPSITTGTYSGQDFKVITVNSAATVTTDTLVNPTIQADSYTGFISVWRGYFFYQAANYPTFDSVLHKGLLPADAVDQTVAGDWKSSRGLDATFAAWFTQETSTPSFYISDASWSGVTNKITYVLETPSNFVATTDSVTVTGSSNASYNKTAVTVTDVGIAGQTIKVAQATDPGAYNAAASASATALNVNRTTLLTSPTDTGTAMSTITEVTNPTPDATGWISANLPILGTAVPAAGNTTLNTHARVNTVTSASAHGLTAGGQATLTGLGKSTGTWTAREPITSTTFDITIDAAEGAKAGGTLAKPPYCSAAFASASIDGPVGGDANSILGHAFWTNPIAADTGAPQGGPNHSDRYAIAAAGNKVYMLTTKTTGYYTTMCASSPRTMYVNVGTAGTQSISGYTNPSGNIIRYTVASSAGLAVGKDVVIAGIQNSGGNTWVAGPIERMNGAYRVTGIPDATHFEVTAAGTLPTGTKTFTNAVVGWVDWQSTPTQLSTTGAAVSYPNIAANGSTVAAVYSELPQGDTPNTTTQNPPSGLAQNAEVWVALSTDSGATWTRHLAGWTSATYDNGVSPGAGCPNTTWTPPSVEGWDSAASVSVNDNYVAVIWNRNNLGKVQAKIGWITKPGGVNTIDWGKSGGGVNNPASCGDSTQTGCNQTLAPAGGKGPIGGHTVQSCPSWSTSNAYSAGACATAGGSTAMAGFGDATRVGFTWVNNYRHSKDGYLPSCNNTACTYTTTENGYGGSAFTANWAPGVYYKYWTPLGGWSATRLISCFEALAIGANTVCSGTTPPATAVQMDGWSPNVALFGDLKLAVSAINDQSPDATHATYTVGSSTGIKVGDRVVVTGATVAGLNGSFAVTAVAAGTFTVLNSTVGATSTATAYRQGSGAGVVWNACSPGAALGCDGGRTDPGGKLLFKESGDGTTWSGDLTTSTDCPGMGAAAGSCSVAVVANDGLSQFFCPATGGSAKFASLTTSTTALAAAANPCGATGAANTGGYSQYNYYPNVFYDMPRTEYVGTCTQGTTGFQAPNSGCKRWIGYQGLNSSYTIYRYYISVGSTP